jgi:beta-galactosidase
MYVRVTLKAALSSRLSLLLLLLSIAAGASAQLQPLRLGAAWYPEQWPEAQWEHDLQLMQDAHMNVVRVGEFAWSTLEPSEGHYDLDWLDRAIALAAKHHIAVVIGTPTDAPPAWLTEKYPDTLGMNADGQWRQHGERRQFSYASPRYRQLCALIVTQLGRRFGHNANVIGWQIGNEYSDESFDPDTRALFQQFLRDKYKTLDNLNKHWATAYWSQTYSAWSQIPMKNSNENPALLLEHKHFVTYTWRSFQRNQIDVLRPLILPAQFITTNIGGLGWSDNWDHYAIAADLDLASWDDYVGQGHLDAPKNAMLNDFVRGWKRQNFWVMETEPGSVNWAPINNALSPGETRALAWQTIGHGADAVLYWQWRSALNGQEQYHGAIVGPDGTPLPIYSEIAQLGRDLDLSRDALAGTSPHAEVAILHDYDSRWAIDFQQFSKDYDQQQVLLRFYEPLERVAAANGQAVDIIDPTSPVDLTQYKLLVAPSLNIISAELAAKLLAYVKQGGNLILGPRSGMKDEFNSLNPQRQPGALAQALGARVEQYYALEKPVGIGNELLSPGSDAWFEGKADTWAEALEITDHETGALFVYQDPGGWLNTKPAVVFRSIGKGTLTYVGTLPDPHILSMILTGRNSTGTVRDGLYEVPSDVELCARSSSTRTVYVAINHGAVTRDLRMPLPMRNLLQPGQPASTNFTLLPQGVAVLAPGQAQ